MLVTHQLLIIIVCKYNNNILYCTQKGRLTLRKEKARGPTFRTSSKIFLLLGALPNSNNNKGVHLIYDL